MVASATPGIGQVKKRATPAPGNDGAAHVSKGDTMKMVADGRPRVRAFPVLEFLAGEGDLSHRMGAWLDAHPYVALALFLVFGLMAMTADSWF